MYCFTVTFVKKAFIYLVKVVIYICEHLFKLRHKEPYEVPKRCSPVTNDRI